MTLAWQSLSELVDEIGRHPSADWLTPSELAELANWCDASRARQWQAGRWLAKRELATLIKGDRLEINIASRDVFGRATTPRVCVQGRAWLGSLSISHVGDLVAVAIDSRPGFRVGVDVVEIEGNTWNDGALANWFSEDEQCWIRSSDDFARRTARLWAVKEAAYKAAQRGEPFIPRDWPALEWLTNAVASCLELTELDDAVIAVVRQQSPITQRRRTHRANSIEHAKTRFAMN